LKQRILRKTSDGSDTFYLPEHDEHFHSVHGAWAESNHIYIEQGLLAYAAIAPSREPIRVLEYGFGTGLNALLTWSRTTDVDSARAIEYTAFEAYPLTPREYGSLNYADVLEHPEAASIFQQMHTGEWDCWTSIDSSFRLRKIHADATAHELEETFQVVYYDAFAPRVQPELWSPDQFSQVAAMMAPGAVLVTYCVQGHARRAMEQAGLEVEKIPGPPGKREMARAWKR